MLPGSLRGGANQHLGAVRVAKLIRTYRSIYGALLADVCDGYGGVYYQCRVLISGGGGGVDDVTNDPLTVQGWEGGGVSAGEKPDVLIGFPDGRRPHPFVLGTLSNARAASNLTTENTDTGTGGPSVGVGNVDDYMIKRNGSRIMILKSGDIALDAAARGRSIKLQVGKNAAFRFGAGKYVNGVYEDDPEMGDDSEFLILGKKFLDYIVELTAKTNELGGMVTALISATPGIAPGYVYTPLVFEAVTRAEYLSGIFKISPKTAE